MKCDEQKPVCQRCERLDRSCNYAAQRTVPPSTSSFRSTPSSDLAPPFSLGIGPAYEETPLYDVSPSPTYALSQGDWKSPEQSRLASLAGWVLANDPMVDQVAVPLAGVWIRLLPQLVHSTRTAYASAAAFGAVYESFLISKSRSLPNAIASNMYCKALAVMQEDVANPSHDTAPLILSCILLACVEVMQRCRGNALQHLEGAFKVLEISSDRNLSLTPTTTATPGTEKYYSLPGTPSPPTAKKDDLFLLLKSLDLQTSTYALARTPALPASPDDETDFEFTSVRGADLQLTIILHNLHHFTSIADKMKYLPASQVPRDVSIEQGRQLARLALWLKCLDANVLHGSKDLTTSAHRHALMLRAQCLIGQIYAATILCPYEAEYDRYASKFQQIIEIAEVVVDAKVESSIKFRPGLGIIQPLLFTAVKYRNSIWRRRAIALLFRAGIEGPWMGKLEGAVAQRVAEVEEETLDMPYVQITPEMIPERKRLCGENLLHDHWGDSTKKDVLRIRLTRCVDVEYMISGKESFESDKHWNLWEEDILV